MTTQAPTVSRPARTLDAIQVWLASSRHQAAAALALYAAIGIVYFGLPVLAQFGSKCACTAGSDPSAYMWNLAWWPHAILHGLNPFVTTEVFAPDHVILGGEGMLVPAVAIPLAPFTLLFGPIFTFNLAMLAAPPLAAFFAFLLCRYVTGSFAASLVGGYLYGFSAYMLGHMLGHLNLVLIFPIPAGVHLMLRLLEGRISERRFVVLMALTMIALLGFATEIAFTFVLIGAVTLVGTYAFVPAMRERLIAMLKPLATAGVVSGVVTSPLLYYAIKGNVTAGFTGAGDIYGADGLSFLIPTNLVRLGRSQFADVASTYTAGAAETGTYLGLPLALILARYAITRWRLVATKILVAMLAVVVVLMLGSHLHLAGHPTIMLPWKLLDRSVLRQVVPVRLGVYMFLILAVLASLWLAAPGVGRRGMAKWAAAALSIVFVFPNLGSGAWHSKPYNPTFFTTRLYQRYLLPGETVMMLPFGQADVTMLWQAETGMYFRVAGGYLGRLLPDDYVREPILPSLLSVQYGPVKPNPAALRSFLIRRSVGAAIVDPTNPGIWPQALAQLGLTPLRVGGVLMYQVAIHKTT